MKNLLIFRWVGWVSRYVGDIEIESKWSDFCSLFTLTELGADRENFKSLEVYVIFLKTILPPYIHTHTHI